LTQNDGLTDSPNSEDRNEGQDSQDDDGNLPDNDSESDASSSDES
jgi:hypothetical protein